MSPKEKYYNFLDEKGISAQLDNIDDLSYSKKLEILMDLAENYESKNINKALNTLYIDYVLLDRVNIYAIKNVLKNICNR